MKEFLDSLKENRYDVKSLEFGDLLDLIDLVAQYHPEDLHVFVNYINNALSHEIWSKPMINDNFHKMCELVNNLGLKGRMNDDQLMRKFTNILHDRLQSKFDGTVHHNLISIIWSLVYKDLIVHNDS